VDGGHEVDGGWAIAPSKCGESVGEHSRSVALAVEEFDSETRGLGFEIAVRERVDDDLFPPKLEGEERDHDGVVSAAAEENAVFRDYVALAREPFCACLSVLVETCVRREFKEVGLLKRVVDEPSELLALSVEDGIVELEVDHAAVEFTCTAGTVMKKDEMPRK
jgi:hypothetical protein